jgi:hypothetical protein
MKKQLAAVTIILTAFGALAQPAKRVVRHRQVRQQERIRQGVRSGELTKEEARKLEQGERQIQQAKREARSDGVVTQEEKKEINEMQNKASKEIYEEKHDAEKAPKAQ